MTNIRLVILGILTRHPMHGYEMKQTIEEYMGDWTDIKFGSIYFSLSKLTDEGYVKIVQELKEGSRPSKTVYRITENGEREFIRLLHELWKQDDFVQYPVDIAVFFMKSLSKEDVLSYIQTRISGLELALLHLENHQTMQRENPYVPDYAFAIMDHSAIHLSAELQWLSNLKNDLDRYY